MVQITSAMSIAKMVGSNRVVLGNGIIHVTGDAKLAPEEEKDLRRKLVQKAEVTLHVRGKDLHCECEEQDLYAAIDLPVELVGQQIDRRVQVLFLALAM